MHMNPIDPQLIAQDCEGLVVGHLLKIGGQKSVWRCAYHQQAYVLKALMADPATLRRLEREIEIMRTCDSPYLPKFGPLPLKDLRLQSGDKLLYFLEEYIDGVPLASVYKPMQSTEIVALGRCVSQALGVLASNGYVHRDVKPMNIMQRNSAHYVLIDAGLALDPDSQAITVSGSIVGTRAYLSPDQLRLPPKDLDIRSDMFALGVTMYECATGEHPFLNDHIPTGDVVHTILHFDCLDPCQFNPDIPPRLAAIILNLLQKDRNQRYRHLEALYEALDNIFHAA
jgi:eukaryotic-like serine/threonine-protein kinase